MGSNFTLSRRLQSRHLMMIAIGGVIGAGYFLGAGGAISIAGPAVLIAYIVGGIISLLVVMLLAEMAVASPVAGSFQVYAGQAIHPLAGFLTGWTYWLAFLIGPASEVIAAGTFLHVWFPSIAIWQFCFIVATLMLTINIISVHFFGEIEFWLSLIKVIALLGFIILGAWALGVPMDTQVSVTHFYVDGGFAPRGIVGIFSAMILVIFSYGGIEAIGTAAEESANPGKDIPKVIIGTILRIVFLYIVSIAVLLTILPWRQAGLSSSPFVDAVAVLGGPHYGRLLQNIMNGVVLSAALSCIDTGIYATSRMLFSLSQQGYFFKKFSEVNSKRKTPIYAILASGLVLYVGALAALYSPNAYAWLASLSGFGFLFAWLMIIISQPGMRKKLEKNHPNRLQWKMPFYPYSQYIAFVLISAVFFGLLFSATGREVLLMGIMWLLLVTLYYWLVIKRKRHSR